MLSPEKSQLAPFLLAGAILLGIGLWCLIISLMGRLGGWYRLAEDYRSDDEMPSTRFRFRSAMLRWVHYGNCVAFGVDHRGLHLASFGPLLGHPRLLIPWSDVSVTPKKSWGIRSAELRFRRTPEIPIVISARLADQISSAADPTWSEALHHASVPARAAS